MLRLERLGKTFSGKPALQDVSIGVEDGQFVGVIGRSGAELR